jgi:hypothetical protein
MVHGNWTRRSNEAGPRRSQRESHDARFLELNTAYYHLIADLAHSNLEVQLGLNKYLGEIEGFNSKESQA